MSEKDKAKFTRRAFLKGTLAVGGALAVGGIGLKWHFNCVNRNFDPARTNALLNGIRACKNPDELPNIIIIFVDDLGYGDLGCYGSGAVKTPVLDRMAEQGVRMTNFYASSPICSPSRAGLLTGRYPIRSHVAMPYYSSSSLMSKAMVVIGQYPYGVTGIPEDEVLLPELLKKRGYKTALTGKWHLGDRSPHLPNENGFDFFYGSLFSNDMSPFNIYRNREIEIRTPVDQNFLTKNTTREAIRFIRENISSPFFLYMAPNMPHEPMHASDEFRARSSGGLYGDAVEEIDFSVSEILNTLKELGLDKKTLVVFSSDNGPWWQGSAGFTRGRKNSPLEGGFRVPFIARWPGVIPEGRISNEMSMNFDLFATCLEIAGIPLPNDRIIDGENILPVLINEAPSPHDTLYFYREGNLEGMRHKNWKYLRRHRSDNGAFPLFYQGPFLFNLDIDPNESYSLIESRPQIAKNLENMMNSWDKEMEENVRGWINHGGS